MDRHESMVGLNKKKPLVQFVSINGHVSEAKKHIMVFLKDLIQTFSYFPFIFNPLDIHSFFYLHLGLYPGHGFCGSRGSTGNTVDSAFWECRLDTRALTVQGNSRSKAQFLGLMFLSSMSRMFTENPEQCFSPKLDKVKVR